MDVANDPDPLTVTINESQDQQGKWKFFVEPVGLLRMGKKTKATWRITNNHRDEVGVWVHGFIQQSDTTKKDPFEKKDKFISVPGNTTMDLQAKLKNLQDEDVFEYQICAYRESDSSCGQRVTQPAAPPWLEIY